MLLPMVVHSPLLTLPVLAITRPCSCDRAAVRRAVWRRHHRHSAGAVDAHQHSLHWAVQPASAAANDDMPFRACVVWASESPAPCHLALDRLVSAVACAASPLCTPTGAAGRPDAAAPHAPGVQAGGGGQRAGGAGAAVEALLWLSWLSLGQEHGGQEHVWQGNGESSSAPHVLKARPAPKLAGSTGKLCLPCALIWLMLHAQCRSVFSESNLGQECKQIKCMCRSPCRHGGQRSAAMLGARSDAFSLPSSSSLHHRPGEDD